MVESRRWLWLGCLVALVVGLDQATKLHVHANFTLHESRMIVDNFFALTYVRNSGAAFGILGRFDATFLRLFFPVITILALGGLTWYFTQVPPHCVLTQWGIGLIMGGALGNGIDRLWLGQVIDFIDVHWYQYHWPAFNMADSAICIGVGLLILEALRSPLPQQHVTGDL